MDPQVCQHDCHTAGTTALEVTTAVNTFNVSIYLSGTYTSFGVYKLMYVCVVRRQRGWGAIEGPPAAGASHSGRAKRTACVRSNRVVR